MQLSATVWLGVRANGRNEGRSVHCEQRRARSVQEQARTGEGVVLHLHDDEEVQEGDGRRCRHARELVVPLRSPEGLVPHHLQAWSQERRRQRRRHKAGQNVAQIGTYLSTGPKARVEHIHINVMWCLKPHQPRGLIVIAAGP